ncbi:transcription factor mef2A-like [Clytia hemisphaerica]
MLDAAKNYTNEDEQRPPLQHQQQPPLQHQQQPHLQHQQQPHLQHPPLQHQQKPYIQQCVRQKAGKCNNPASANSKGMCELCYVQFQAAIANLKKHVQNQPGMDDYYRIGLCFQCNQRPSNASYDVCRKCFEDKIRNTKAGDDDVFANKPNDNAYESLEDYQKQNIPPNVSPNLTPNVPPNGPHKAGSCNQCGKQYFRENAFGLCEKCFETIKKQQEEAEEKHKMCWYCNKNFADDNALGTCTVCVTTQGNLIKEAQQEKQGNGKNLNVGRGPANFNEQALPHSSHQRPMLIFSVYRTFPV